MPWPKGVPQTAEHIAARTKPQDIHKRFWAKVKKGKGCWIWIAADNGHGYGQFSMPGSHPLVAHKVAWSLEYGNIPPGHELHHTCFNKKCVKLSHLKLMNKTQHRVLHAEIRRENEQRKIHSFQD